MEESIVDETSGEANAVVGLRKPSRFGRAHVQNFIASMNRAHNRQPRKRRPAERHGPTGSDKIPHNQKDNFIVTRLQVRPDVECVVVPDPWTATCRPNGNPLAINVKFVPGVSREVQKSSRVACLFS